MSETSKKNICVLGSGIMGLTSAYLCVKEGWDVSVFSDRRIEDTTSSKAAASFKPSKVDGFSTEFEMLTRSWRIYEHFLDKDCGVWKHYHWEVFDEPRELPVYKDVVEEFTELSGASVPGNYPLAWRYKTYFIDTSVFIPFLTLEVEKSGGEFFLLDEELPDFEAVCELGGDLVVNCTGLGSRELFGDSALYPARGQIALTTEKFKMDWSVSANDTYYIYSRTNDVVLGGTNEIGEEVESTTDEDIARIIEANARINPSLLIDEVTKTYAGIRPTRRGGPRVELETHKGIPVVHNYGHGGAGMTLAWGSSEMAVELCREAIAS